MGQFSINKMYQKQFQVVQTVQNKLYSSLRSSLFAFFALILFSPKLGELAFSISPHFDRSYENDIILGRFQRDPASEKLFPLVVDFKQ
jgi:hypothetical protein